MKTQIPIYRAKKIGSDKNIEGSHIYSQHEEKHYIRYEMDIRQGFTAPRVMTLEIDHSTLAIHFPDMIDSEGNKIFASLSEDGKGGDIQELSHYVQWSDEKVTKTAIYKRGLTNCFFHEGYSAEVTGIQQ